MSELVTVSIAAGSHEEARRLAEGLVAARLAACVQIFPIHSTYRWHGTIEQSEETMLVAKTLASAFPALEAHVRAHHGYEIAEIIAVPVSRASEPYADWVRANVGV